jgi:hypothetical protein
MAIIVFQNTSEGRVLAAAVADPKHTWFDGRNIVVYTGVDIPSIDPRPTVTKWQLVQACADAGISEAQIDASVALLTAKRQRRWKYCDLIDRDSPLSSNLRTNMTPVPTPTQWNAIFLAAAALDPLIV